MIRPTLLAIFALSCVPPEVKIPDDNDTQDSDSDSDSDGFQDDGVSPYLVEGTATCITLSNGEKSWSFQAEVDDAQGKETIRPLQDIVALDAGTTNEIFRKPNLACNNKGTCIGSLREELVSILCADQAQYTFRVYLMDLDGNQYPEGFALTWLEPESND